MLLKANDQTSINKFRLRRRVRLEQMYSVKPGREGSQIPTQCLLPGRAT